LSYEDQAVWAFVKTKLRNARGNLADLRFGMRPGIFRIRYEFVDQPNLDMLYHRL
jgi:hypothetical protein